MSSNVYEEVLFIVKKHNKLFPDYVPVSKNDKTYSDYKHEYIKSILFEISNVSDGLWASLGSISQNWYNEAVNAVQGGGTLDFFPGLPEFVEVAPVVHAAAPRPVTPVFKMSEESIKAGNELRGNVVKERKKRRTKREMEEARNMYTDDPTILKDTGALSVKREATTEERQDIRRFILWNDVSKEEIKKYLNERGIWIHQLALHRIYTEGVFYREEVREVRHS
jgi:hypothetical protein